MIVAGSAVFGDDPQASAAAFVRRLAELAEDGQGR
jgi:hypothetical protein